jgi:hypothetical protein
MAWVFFAVLLVCLAYSALFALSGKSILGRIKGFEGLPASANLGLAFFFGMALFLFLFALSGAIIPSAKASLLISTLLLLGIAWLGKKIWLSAGSMDGALDQFAAAFIISSAALLLIWLPPLNTPDGQIHYNHDLFGSANSGRYANIAGYVSLQDAIPIVNQNFGQSLLASIPMLLGQDAPYLALYLWLSLSVAFSILILYGLFRHFKLPKAYALLAVFAVMVGNSALSLTHVLTIDSGSPLIYNGYTDSIFSLWTFLVFLIWAMSVAGHPHGQQAPLAAVPVVLGFAWNLTSGQNIIFAAFVLAFVLLRLFLAKKSLAFPVLLFAAFLIFAAAGATRGGMFFPKSLDHSRAEIVGSYSPNSNLTAKYSPGVYYFFSGPYNTWTGSHVLTSYFSQNLSDSDMEAKISARRSELSVSYGPFKTLSLFALKLQYYVFYHETLVFDALRVFFFPIAGILAAFYLAHYGKKGQAADPGTGLLFGLADYLLIILALGLCIAFSVSIGSFKAEFARFLIIPYWLGLVLLMASLWHLTCKLEQKRLVFVWLALALVMTAGPVFDLGINIAKNLAISSHGVDFPQRVASLATMDWRLTTDLTIQPDA